MNGITTTNAEDTLLTLQGPLDEYLDLGAVADANTYPRLKLVGKFYDLGSLDPAIVVRDHEVELGYFQLDPCNLAPGQASIVADVVGAALKDAASIPMRPDDLDRVRNGGVNAYLNWSG